MHAQTITPSAACAQCGDPCGPHPRGRYCSWRCYMLARRLTSNAICGECGTAFYVFPSRLAAGRGMHCSQACAGAARRFVPSVDFWQRVQAGEDDQCWLWAGPLGSYGYGEVKASGVRIGAHRMAWMLSNKRDVPDGMVVRHKCHVRLCCNPAHLELGTVQDNNQDKMQARRQANGERCHTAKLTAESVVSIRASAKGGATAQSLAAEYGVTRRTISDVISGRTWSHIP